jgi:hypothetical protein
MIKKCLFAVALLSLALAGGCAKGGNGVGSGITVTVSDGSVPVVGATLSVTFTAAVKGTTNTAVTWSLRGTACTGTPNPCGTITTAGVYQAPATAPNPSAVTIRATSQADSLATGELTVNVTQVTVVVTPTVVTVGQGLVQQFTAVAVPDNAPQTFQWTCSPSSACAGFVPGPNSSDVAVYTAPSSPQNGVVVTATSTVPESPAGVGTSKVSVVSSRLPSGAYAFRFSGYDSGNPPTPVAVAGSLTVAVNGSITGVEDVLTGGAIQQVSITSGSYTPTSSNNNLGTLTLHLSGGATNQYTAVLTSSGIIRMIESDSTGRTGSGVMEKSAAIQFNAGAQTFVFGFTGVDAAVNGNRVGYVGLLPMTPTSATSGTISGGLLDVNDNGSDACGTTPCNVTGTYQLDGTIPGLWHMTLNSVTTLDFDFFVSAGQTSNAPNPLTLYAISTDDPTSHPALSGSMVYQFPMTYNNAAFKGTSVSNLTGASANVSLTVGSTDGTSGGSGGTGTFLATFDQNNNGTILSVPPAAPFSYTYVATGSSNGRYIFQMLGNPTVTPAVAPLPFVLYASGANRGFLLDQSSSAVMTGTMDPQPSKASGSYTPTELPGTFAAATIRNSDSSLAPFVENLLFTSPGGAVYNATGIQNPGNHTLTGTYTMTTTGVGTITLTAPAAATFAIYAIDFDVTNFVITDFMMIETDQGVPSSITFAQE